MTSARRLLLVHAHPDDECLSTGGTLARYAAGGDHVSLVTCTNGEEGEIADVPDLGPHDEVRASLADVRVAELREACRRLGPLDLRLLGYRDSGMEGTPANASPGAFINQPLEKVVSRLVVVLREVRPQVVVTYNEYGMYGHPDHIRAHRATVAAVRAAGDAGYAAGRGPAHEVGKLYHTAVPKSVLRQAREAFSRAPVGGGEAFPEEEVERIGTDDDRVTTRVDVAAYMERKMAAIAAHRTQLGTTEPFLELDEEARRRILGAEYYVLADSRVGYPEELEDDLFERIPG